MSDAGSALMGIGRASGDNRAIEAARAAIDSPLLELSIDGAKGILFNITGGTDMGMYEIDEAAKAITEASDPDANIIFGAIIDEAMSGEIKVTVIATGFDVDKLQRPGLDKMRASIASMNAREQAQQQSSLQNSFSATPQAPEIDESMEQAEDEIDVPAFIRRKLK
jgi:cell division protein FtsZ